ncbi:MAG: heparin lyase I family protein [Cyclobacteriaceae bacterium]|nr:heparin lyase I family protein [Cyclobacteriaceae bacterium HetDA_MAG_MS6]
MRALLKMPGIFSVLFASLLALSAHGQIASFCGGSPPTSVDVRHDSDAIISVSSPSYQGGTSLKFQTNTNSSTTEGWATGHDRCEARVMTCNTSSMFSSMHYTGFMLYLDNNVDGTNADESYEILLQMRQCDVGASPPITVQIEENGSSVDLILAIRTQSDPITGRHNSASHTKQVSVSKGTWMQVTLGTYINPTSGGQVKWWIDGVLKEDYTGPIGRSELNQAVEIKYGIYRGPTFPPSKGAETVYFDQIAYGTTYNSVQPSHCAAGSFPDLTKWYFIENVEFAGERIKAQTSAIELMRQNGSDDRRQWKFIDAGGGFYHLESKAYPGERIKAQTSSIELTRQAGSDDRRRWKLVDAGGGSYYIESKAYPGQRIKAQTSSTTLSRQAGSDNRRKWVFIEAGTVARMAPEGFDQLEVVQEASNEFRIFPNPVNDRFTISFSANKNQQIRYHLFDMMGRQVRSLEKMISEGNQLETVDVAGLVEGIYVLDLWINGSRLTKKISIN